MSRADKAPTKKLLVELAEPLSDRLNDYCERVGATRGGVIRVALEAYLGQVEDEESEHFVVRLQPGSGKTFWAFRRLFDYPSKDRIVESALLTYIEQRCAETPQLRDRLEAAKREDARKRMYSIENARLEGENGG